MTKPRILSVEGAGGGFPRPPSAPGNGLGFDPEVAIAHVSSRDPALGRLIRAVGPVDLPLRETSTVFVALAEAIVYQQLSGKAAATIFGRVRALFPRSRLTAERVLSAPEDRLRGAGLSRSKLLALRDLARRAATGELPTLGAIRRMEDEAIVERLTQVRGIGRWTAQMLLIFRLGRPDVLPVDDYGIRKGFAVTFKKRKLPAPKDVEAYGERWRPYRTVASCYLWRAVELDRARRP